jgi:RNA polymerase sigma-70 factor (ECF subfamily)
MTDDPVENLLEQLSRGDVAAAEQVFVTYEPYLRLVVRRLLPAHLRARFDSVDIVQSVWADLLERLRAAGWRFRDAEHMRAFLVMVTRNRFLDRLRQHEASIARERAAPGKESGPLAPAPQPGPSEVAQAEELWERMLALCPPEHQDVLRLKREGLSVEEVAARTGLHPGSIRRILRTLAQRLAVEDSAASGDAGAP